jgi:hypothetical protein
MSTDRLSSTLRQLLGGGEPEVSCDVCFAQLDRYVEAELLEHNPEAVVPGMHAHLVGCPACAEEYQSLRALLTSE